MTETPNPYQPPAAPLETDRAVDHEADEILRATLDGRTRLSVEDVLRTAWIRLKGSKRFFWLGVIALQIASLPFAFVGGVIRAALFEPDSWQFFAATVFEQVLVSAALLPLFVGVNMAMARHAAGRRVQLEEIFATFRRTGPLLLAWLIMTPLVWLGFLLLIVPGIFLSVRFSLANYLIVDRKLNPRDAIDLSYRLVRNNGLSVFAIGLVSGLLMTLSALLLFIPLIWTLPWFTLCGAVIYCQLAGVATR